MKPVLAAALGALALTFAAPAHADVDTDFSNTMQTYGVYGQKDYNAWLAKIACKRMDRGVDADAFASARFIDMNLAKNMTVEQSWQFLDKTIEMYCPAFAYRLADAARPR